MADRVRSASFKRPSKHEVVAGARHGQLFVITATMAVVDVEDRLHLAIISSAVVAALTSGVYMQARTDGRSTEESLMCAAPILVAASSLLVLLRVFSKTVEGMDVYARKYAQLRETELGHREGDELGPEPFAHDGLLRQPGEPTTEEELLARAEGAKDSFRDEVVLVLAGSESEAVGPNVKGIDRAKEKVRLQCDGDARLLRDVLRCSIICPTIDALCVSSKRLEVMRDRGLVKILEV